MKYTIPLLFFFFGIVVFYNYADFEKPVWGDIYFMWDKTKDVLLIGTIFYLLKIVSVQNRVFKTVLVISKSVFIFALIRLAWEVISLVTGIDINRRVIIDIIFILFILVWVWPLLKILWQRRNS